MSVEPSDPLGVNPPDPTPPEIPDFHLLRRIGGGSYGEVWLARNIMGTFRAVKVVYRRTFDHHRPFDREFSGIRKFEPISRSHPSQLNILHVGRNEEEGYFYYVMDLADDPEKGREINPDTYEPKTLKSEQKRRGRFTLEETLQVGLALITALDHLHQNGLIHRDIKPSNIIFVGDQPKLADIGLVADADETRSFVGTEGYLPPEGPGSRQGDLYSLGKVLYEICMGRDRQEFPELPTNLAELPDREALVEFNEILMKACQTDPQQRYHNAEEMRSELVLVQGGKSIRRARRIERQLALLKKSLLVIGLFSVVFFVAYYQAEKARRLATERLAMMLISNGLQEMEQGDLLGSMLWFVEAFRLEQDDPKREAVHRYRFGSLWEHAPRLLQMVQHEHVIYYAEISRDGRRLLTAGGDQKAMVWDLADGEPISAPMQHDQHIKHAHFGGDGKWVATGAQDGVCRIWNAMTGDPITSPLRHPGRIQGLEISPDDTRLLVATTAGTLHVWNLELPSVEQAFDPLQHDGSVHMATFSPDGTRILSCADGGSVRLWNTESGEPDLAPIFLPEDSTHVAFSPDGQRFVTAGEGFTAKLWDASSGDRIGLPMAHDNSINSAEFSPDGRQVVTASYDFTAQVWNAATGSEATPPLAHEDIVTWAEFSPDGQWVLTSSLDGTARVWDAQTGRLIRAPLHHTPYPFSAAFGPEGCRVVTTSANGTALVWNIIPPGQQTETFWHDDHVWQVEFDATGNRLISASADQTARIWDTLGKADPLVLPHEVGVSLATFHPRGDQAMTTAGNHVYLWDLPGGRLARPPMEHPQEIKHAALSPDGRFIVTACTDGNAYLWSAESGEQLAPTYVHDGPLEYAAFSPEGDRVVTAGRDGSARVWERASGTPITPKLEHGDAVLMAAFSPDGAKILTSSNDNTARVWDAATGEPLAPPLQHDRTVRVAAFSPDGGKVATASYDYKARIWDALSGEPLIRPLNHAGDVRQVDFNPDGTQILTAAKDRTARVWDAESGIPITPYYPHHGFVWNANFGPDGRQIATASHDGAVRVFTLNKTDFSLNELTQIARMLSGHHIDATSSLAPIDGDELSELWRNVKKKAPEAFSLTEEKIQVWHRQKAAEYEKQGQWFAAEFHLNRLVADFPDDSDLRQRLDRVQATLSENRSADE